MNDSIDGPPVADPVADRPGDDWQPLPPRSRTLFVLAYAPTLALPAAGAGFALAMLVETMVPWLTVLVGLVLGGAAGLWLGLKQYRYSSWRHDAQGLAVRRGKFWQRETRVPATRVQHLDIKRGPLQRRRDLATLVVHTAGTSHSAVSVTHLDASDAERLREALSRQIDHDGAD